MVFYGSNSKKTVPPSHFGTAIRAVQAAVDVLSAPPHRVSLTSAICEAPIALCPQSPRAKFLQNFSKRSAKNAAKFWRNVSQIFVLQFPWKMAAKNFTKNPQHFPRCTKLSFFHCCNSGGLGAQHCSWRA